MSDPAQVMNSTPSSSAQDQQDLVGHSEGDVLVIFVLWGVLLPLVAAAGLVGNTLTMLVLWRREMNSTTILYLRALVVTDTGILLGSVLTLTPVACADYLHGETLMYFKHSVYPVIRTPAYYVIMTLQQINVWLTVSVSVERYVAICHPFRAVRLITRKNTVRLMIGLAVVSLVYNLPRVFAYRTVSCDEARGNENETRFITLSWNESNVSDFQINTQGGKGFISLSGPTQAVKNKEDVAHDTTLFSNNESVLSDSLSFPPKHISTQNTIVTTTVPSTSPRLALSATSKFHSRLISPSNSSKVTSIFSSSTPSSVLPGHSTSHFTSSLQSTMSRSRTSKPASPTTTPSSTSSCLDVVTTAFGQTSFYMFYRTIMYLIIIYVLPFLPLLILNACLFRELMSMQKRKVATSKQEDNEANLSLVLVLIVIVFIFCQTPGLISQFDLIPSSLFISWLAFSNFLFATNSAVNFLIYTAFGRKFRRVLLRVFRHICTKKSSNGRWMSSMRFSQVPSKAQDCESNGEVVAELASSGQLSVECSNHRDRNGTRKKNNTRTKKRISFSVSNEDHTLENYKTDTCFLVLSGKELPPLSTSSKTSNSEDSQNGTHQETNLFVENHHLTQFDDNVTEEELLNRKSWDLDLDR